MDQNNTNNQNPPSSENSDNKTENTPVSENKPGESNAPVIPPSTPDAKPTEDVKPPEEPKPVDPPKPEDADKPLVEEKKDAAMQAVDSAMTPPSSPAQPKKGRGVSMAVIIVFLVISFLSGLLLAGMYFQNQLQQAKVAKETSDAVKKVVVIGTNATDPPMESVNSKGALVGYDIDLGYRVANEMGVKAEFKNVEWDGIFQKLLDKKIDMIMASVTITDERKKLYAFSDPYINAGQVIISRKDHPITTVTGLQGKKISVQKDTTNEKEAYKYTGKDMVQVYTEYDDIAKAVSLGSAEAAISDLTIAKGLISNYDNIKITSDPFTNEYYGIVMRKDDVELQKKVNAALSVLRVNGVLTDLKQKWLE